MSDGGSAIALNSIFAGWDEMPNSGDILAISVMPDDTLLGIGMDNTLFTRANLAYWTNVPNSAAVLGVTVMTDGSILGIGMDNSLFTRATLSSPWVGIPNSGSSLPSPSCRMDRSSASA